MEIVFIIIMVIFMFCMVIYNQLVKVKVKCEEALSGIDVGLSKRYNVLTNLQNTVKGAAKHEKEVLESITGLRTSMSINEKENLNQQYDQVQSKLLALAESYPDLKTSENFLQLQNSIVDCEEHLQAARRFYNSNVSIYNQKCMMFPSNIIASIAHFERYDFFMASIDEKENYRINL